MRIPMLAACLILLPGFGGCFVPSHVGLEIGDLSYALAADPHAGVFLHFNFTIYNNGTNEARNVSVAIDGLDRSHPKANHYGRAERSIQRVPVGGSFVIEGRLDVYSTCHFHDPDYRDCASAETYFTMRARPANGPEAVKIVRDESGH